MPANLTESVSVHSALYTLFTRLQFVFRQQVEMRGYLKTLNWVFKLQPKSTTIGRHKDSDLCLQVLSLIPSQCVHSLCTQLLIQRLVIHHDEMMIL